MNGSVITLRDKLAYLLHKDHQHILIRVWVSLFDVYHLKISVECLDSLVGQDIVWLAHE
jgi:hypothetical protein